MNNPLVQKTQYYLNESHRLNEELKSEIEYSELLESLLFQILGEEDFNKLFEDVQTAEREEQMNKAINKAGKANNRKELSKLFKRKDGTYVVHNTGKGASDWGFGARKGDQSIDEGFKVGEKVRLTNPLANPGYEIVGKDATHYHVKMHDGRKIGRAHV